MGDDVPATPVLRCEAVQLGHETLLVAVGEGHAVLGRL
jgi:hypothetical protein